MIPMSSSNTRAGRPNAALTEVVFASTSGSPILEVRACACGKTHDLSAIDIQRCHPAVERPDDSARPWSIAHDADSESMIHRAAPVCIKRNPLENVCVSNH
jgi:hypothetical protein